MRKAAFAVGLVLLFATTALAGGKIVIDNQTIEFSQDTLNRWVVKHNGVDKGVATEVGKADLIVTLPDGSRVIHDDRKIKNIFIIYQVNPTCYTYWNGQSWIRYCY